MVGFHLYLSSINFANNFLLPGEGQGLRCVLAPASRNTAFKNHENFKMIFKSIKDRLKKEQLSNIVYSIPCKDNNCKAVYKGQTKGFLKSRINEHKNDIRKCPTKQNALTKHTIEKHHFFDFDVTLQVLRKL